ncbi:hypothetical protein KIL84_020964 [Mauremys mutica]|uniref:Uncharacterized protein n=1 Tax=Mauremys mutica TaxID=74926 RepID=A0A9D3XBL5_9SAUR|nr:hypothetical protein KIL84_020964 [Mauremys mutica]
MGNAASAGCYIRGAGGQGSTCQQGARPPIPPPPPELPWIRNTSWVEAAAPCATKGSPPTLPPRPSLAQLQGMLGVLQSCFLPLFFLYLCVRGAGEGSSKSPVTPVNLLLL